MSITTTTELKAAVAGWLHRDDDPDIDARQADFITLAEAWINRALRVRAMEADFSSTALVDGAATLPAGFLAFKELRCDSDNGYTLEPRPLEWIRNQRTDAGLPGYFAVARSSVICWPSAGSIVGTYYESLPSLNDNTSNWLLESHPDLYLFACLTEGSLWALSPEASSMWRQRALALAQEIQSADTANSLGGGPLSTRNRP